MRVLVSGSTGLIGSALVRRMLADGHRVHRLVRGSPAAGEAAWDLAKARVDSERLPGGALGGLDAVVHLAGAPIASGRWTSARRREILRSRVRTSEVLASAIAAATPPPPVFVAMSAVGYYGDRGDEELTEESGGGTGFLAAVCGEWERANSAAAASGVRVVTLRSGIVLDRSGGALAAQLRLFRLGLGGRIGPGTQWMSWITLRDEIEVIMHAIATPSLEGAANAVAPCPVRNVAFTKALAEAVHRPAFLAVPSPALRLIFGRDLAEELLLASQRVVPARLVSSGFHFESETIDAALAAVLGTGAARSGTATRGGA